MATGFVQPILITRDGKLHEELKQKNADLRRTIETRHVKQRPVTFDGETFASELKGASHPLGISMRVVGATVFSRSPLRDRSTLPTCVIDLASCAIVV